MRISILLFLGLYTFSLSAQIDYFPPLNGDQWDTLSITEAGWCDDQLEALFQHLETENTKAFMILKDGKIVVEKYFGDTNIDTNLPWFSAGKTVTSLLIGIAQEQNLLSIEDKTSDHLGVGWTSLSQEQEDLITIRHQLTMTTGLDDTENFCVTPECLNYLADPGTRWAYHNGPYTLLTNVIENAGSTNINIFATTNFRNPTGISGVYIPLGTNRIFYSPVRDMARMSSLILNKGTWGETVVLGDSIYFQEMTSRSQDINEAYGYLWWLNGSSSYMLPSSQIVFPGSLSPDAPAETYTAIGKNGQYLDIIPSMNISVIRMGDAPDDDLVPLNFHREMWGYLSQIFCTTTSSQEVPLLAATNVYPNPFSEKLFLETEADIQTIKLYDALGHVIMHQNNNTPIDGYPLSPGLYFLELIDQDQHRIVKKVIKH